MRTEVFSEDGVVGFADFTSLETFGRMVSMCRYKEDREETYDEFEVLREGESEYGQHTFKWVIGIIDSERRSPQLGRRIRRNAERLTQQRGPAYPDSANTLD